jgi:MoaA/NifB/PqqE/SkfB family radical SAM enzyme
MRGPGVYEKVMASMERMKKRNLLFGMSLLLTKHNYDLMTSRDFYLTWRDRGVVFAWNFLYMPVGSDPIEAAKLMPTPEQRYNYGEFIQKFRNEEPIYIMDFWADAPFVHGCIAGGRRYLHINHKGDVEPCVFAHIAQVNIKNTTLRDAIGCELFEEIRKRQPFSPNLYLPCMLIDHPKVSRWLYQNLSIYPTHPGAECMFTNLANGLNNYSKKLEELYSDV